MRSTARRVRRARRLGAQRPDHTLAFARLAGVRHLVTFHHDPAHDDDTLTRLLEEARAGAAFPFDIVPGTEGLSVDLGDPAHPDATIVVAR